MDDKTLKKLILWKEKDSRLAWEEISVLDAELKNVRAQWGHLLLVDSVLYSKWVDHKVKTSVLQLLIPSCTSPNAFGNIAFKYSNL